MINNKIDIHSLHTIEELEQVRRLESNIWGASDSIPTHQTITAVKNGGLVLGAFFNGELIGFQYSFPGFNGQSVYLCSHVLGTDEKFRNKGIGEMLKQAQAKEALKLGYSLITWTYDPLESINGYLNIGKLGGVCSTYIPNCYGEMDDLLNSGIPSDRFLVEWHIGQEKAADTFGRDWDEDDVVNQSALKWTINEHKIPVVSPAQLDSLHKNSIIFIPIPRDYRTIRENHLELAKNWRLKTRSIFSEAFTIGFQVSGFKKMSNPNIPVNFYILKKESSL